MRVALTVLWLGVVSAGVISAGAAQAQAPEHGAAAAKKHFVNAKKSYKAGAYREAISELNQAIALDPNGKDLFYNLGLVHEKLGEVDEAIVAFKRYSELETDTDELEKAIQTVRRLEGARDELAKKRDEEARALEANEDKPPPLAAAPRADTQTPADKPKKGRLDAWVYTTGGVAIAALGVGIYYGVQALSTRQSTEDATGKNLSVYGLQDRAKTAHDQALVADIAFTVSAASAGAAALFYFTRDAKPRATSVGAVVTPGSGFVALEGAF
ncbi:MAG: tetratricopeptide repeat protein [Myxococcales bacterium]|nr:tetratricopeptide repeat protein [Myxococcales bacterium]